MGKVGKINCGISRQDAFDLMEQYLPQDNMQKHCIVTEAIMRALAKKLVHNVDFWGIAGLLHDLDYADTKEDMNQHGLVT